MTQIAKEIEVELTVLFGRGTDFTLAKQTVIALLNRAKDNGNVLNFDLQRFGNSEVESLFGEVSFLDVTSLSHLIIDSLSRVPGVKNVSVFVLPDILEVVEE